MKCRVCSQQAASMRKEYTNETVLFTYTHSDGTDHKMKVNSIVAEEMFREDLVEKRIEGGFTLKGLHDRH